MAKGQEKLIRLLKVISMLKTPHGRTISSMAEELDSSARTIYRYIETLEASGFPIDKSCSGERWFIVDDNQSGQLVNFDVEEANLIRELVEYGAHNHPMKEGLLQKLYVNSELKPLSENITDARINGIVNTLKRAIEGEYKVILKS
jgi:predicted DNA-binding transcriptional regulator YafY